MAKLQKKTGFVLIMVTYLLGIFMGALDTGIVTPARTIIQNNLGVGQQTGIWMITIYTLAYAASIPIMGKLADRYGRKNIYLMSIFLFGVGSLFCGLSQNMGSFTVLLIARALQAVGGGGIVPVATAEFGTSFPQEKRGMALGLVGGVYGIANIFGASAGSAILDIFGKNQWQFIFYVNVPITVFILIAGFFVLKNNKAADTRKIDILGILTLILMILSLLYGLTKLNFFDFVNSIKTTSVYPFLIIFVLLVPVFIFIEKRASDPVMHLKYFTNKNIVLTLCLAFTSGILLMGIVFVPQFCENALKIPSGSGGYLVIILGVFAGIGAPISGRLIDKFGEKIVIGFGFSVSVIGALFLFFVATDYPNILTVIISIVFMGLGIGFTMGTPLNYMMLSHTDIEESNSALATLSLVRSIGTSIAPAIMVGFIASAGAMIQPNVMKLLPTEVNTPSGTIAVNFQMDSSYVIPQSTLDILKSSDVTTITDNLKTFSGTMFETMTSKQNDPAVKSVLSETEKAYKDAIETKRPKIEKTFQTTLNIGFKHIYLLTAITSFISIVILLFYRRKKVNKNK